MALETAWVSFITFGDAAKEITPLTEVGKVVRPQLIAGGSTNLGAALKLLLEKLKSDVRANTPQQKGDWKPLIFLMSDGQPTDQQWQTTSAELHEHTAKRTANVIALGCGNQIDTNVLKQLANVVLLMEDMTTDNIHSFFKWVSQSIRITSRSVSGPTAGDEAKVELPPLPPGIEIVV